MLSLRFCVFDDIEKHEHKMLMFLNVMKNTKSQSSNLALAISVQFLEKHD